jgi:Pyridoxamine 5'-phosphate oxidase
VTSIPRDARRVLRDGALCYLASAHEGGPHTTPVVFAFDAGRIWLTTSRRSVKARTWRRDRAVAGLVRHGDEAVSFRGTARTYDALDLSTWPAATLSGPLLARAATRFSVKNARFFAGYAVDANRVPFAWTPPGRVFVAVRPLEGFVTRAGRVADRWGDVSARAVRSQFAFVPPTRRRSLDLAVPVDVRGPVGSKGAGVLTMSDGDGRLTVVPVTWRRSASEDRYDAAVTGAVAGLAGVTDGCPAALTLDRASTWRAADMTGLLVQGPAEVFDLATVRTGKRAVAARLPAAHPPTEGNTVLVRIRPARLVWWRGWSSGTVTR